MKMEQEQIRDFMVKAGQATPDKPVIPPAQVRALRLNLIAEELLELATALGCEMEASNLHGTTGTVYVTQVREPTEKDLVEAYDAILDLLVVVIGSGVAMGTNLAPGWDEVHRSNMSKFIDGHKREDGKWIKGPSYTPANLKPIIDSLIAQAIAHANQPTLPYTLPQDQSHGN